MKITLLILFLLVLVVIIILFTKGANSRKGVSPGLVEGKLSQCSKKPNCICSENKKDSEHFLKPFDVISKDPLESMAILKSHIVKMGGILDTEEQHYHSYQFSSSVFGFVDDLELRLDSDKNRIHIRSASRVGTSDMGVNRKRVTRLQQLYQAKKYQDFYEE